MENFLLEIPEGKLFSPEIAGDDDGIADIFDASYLLGLGEPAGDRRNTEKLLLFKLDSQTYAIELDSVVEVCRYLPLTTLPNVPAWLTGITNLRGEILSIVDLRSLDSGAVAAIDPKTKIVVVTDKTKCISIGILVDQILEIISAAKENISPYDPGDAAGLLKFAHREVEHKQSPVQVLNIKTLISSLSFQTQTR